MSTDPHSPVVLEFELAQPLRAIEDQLGAWLWAWLWPASAGDMLRPPPPLANGLRDEPAFLVVDRSRYAEEARNDRERAERSALAGHTLVTFDEPARRAYDELNASNETVLLVTLDGLPPATLTAEDRGEGSLVRVTTHPCLYSSRSDESWFETDLAVLGLTLPLVEARLSRPTLARLMPSTPPDTARRAIGRYHCGPAIHAVADGAWVSPRIRQWARSVPGAATRMSDLLAGHQFRDRFDDPRGMLERLEPLARAISGSQAPSLTRWVEPEIRLSSRRPNLHWTQDQPLSDQPHVLFLMRSEGVLERHEGTHQELLFLMRSGLPGDWDTAILQGMPRAPHRSDPEPATVPIAALALRGARRQRALPRLLEHGPWKVEPLGDDGLLVRASASSGPDGAVYHQREVAMGWIHGLLPPLQPKLGDVASYDPDTRSVLVDTRHPRPSLNAFAEVAAWARDRAEDPKQPVEHVIAPFADPYLARLWMPYLWLCEVQVWTVQDEAWTRIDRGYQPRWGRPGWFDWEAS